jgi:hypothetical protein
MKGLLFCVGISISSLTSIAQPVYRAYETGTASLDSITSWSYKNTKPVNLTITFQNKVVKLNDREKTTYRLKEEGIVESTQEIQSQTVWNAVDKNERNCELSIIRFKSDTTRIQITYSNTKYLASIFYNVTKVRE